MNVRAPAHAPSCEVQTPGLQPDVEAPPSVHLMQSVSQVRDSMCGHDCVA